MVTSSNFSPADEYSGRPLIVPNSIAARWNVEIRRAGVMSRLASSGMANSAQTTL